MRVVRKGITTHNLNGPADAELSRQRDLGAARDHRSALRVRSNYWNESGGGYARVKSRVARTGIKPFCCTFTGAQPVS